MDDELQFYSPWQDTRDRKGALPHWEQPGATYFVTWRLADSIAQAKVEQLNEEKENWCSGRSDPLSFDDEQTYHRLFSGKIDEWLDAGLGSCIFRNSHLRKLLESAILYFDQERYIVHSFVIMPNHVHVLTSLNNETNLAELLHSWKSFSAQVINKSRNERGVVWQKEYFDRLIRDARHFSNCIRYIRQNPEKAKLNRNCYTLFENKLAKSID